jgi:leader peptidase (prepilin peptidase)/N-methyltransferase
MYPTVETGTALLFVLQCSQLGWQPLLGVRLVFVAVMIVLCVIDLQTKILPDVITVPGVAAGLVSSFFFEPGWVSSLVGAVAGGGILWVAGRAYFLIRGQHGLGIGDVKMLAMIGAFLGWQTMLITLLFASLLGSAVGVAMIILRQGGMQSVLPFGSFLAVSALISTHMGQQLLRWYSGFF